MKVKDLIEALQKLNAPNLYVHIGQTELDSGFEYDSVSSVEVMDIKPEEGDESSVIVVIR